MTAGYSSTPLAKKLGIRPSSTVALLDAPSSFPSILRPSLPHEVDIRFDARAIRDLFLVFATRKARLRGRLRTALNRIPPDGMIWTAWPKKSSSIATDLAFDEVQALGLAAGLVDNKVGAIDDDWSALRFVIPLARRR